MSEGLRLLLSDPWVWAFVTGAAGLAALAIRRYVANAVDHRFAVRLESHRHELGLVADSARYELQRRLAGASLYLDRQHAAAAEIYAAVRIAHGAVSRLFGIQRVPDLTDCNEDDIGDILNRYDVLRGKQDELIAAWRADRRKGAEAIQSYLVDMALPHAEAKQQEARNRMYLNEIYFSDAAITAFDEWVGESNKWIVRRQFPLDRGERVEPLGRDDLNKSLEKVQAALRAELGGGYVGTDRSSPPLQQAVVDPKHESNGA